VTPLLDVNVLVSLAWPNHVHHAPAQRWFGKRGRSPWATTPFTEGGFVRVSSNGAAVPTAVTPSEALLLLARLRDVRGHTFLPDDVELVLGDRQVDPHRVVSHRSVSDALLLALARRHGARLATFDRGMKALAGAAGDDIALIPTS